MDKIYLLSVWIHILAAAIWVGGMFFLVLVLLPAIRRLPSQAAQLIHLTGIYFRRVGWVALGLLIITGVINLAYRGIRWHHLTDSAFWKTPFGRLLGLKLLLVGIVLILSTIHDFWVGPRATQWWQEKETDPRTLRLRRQASWIGRANLILALLIVALAVALVRGGW